MLKWGAIYMLAAHPSEVYVWETLIIADKWFLRPKPRTAGFQDVVGSGSLWLDDSLVKFSQNEITCSQLYCFLFQNGHTAAAQLILVVVDFSTSWAKGIACFLCSCSINLIHMCVLLLHSTAQIIDETIFQRCNTSLNVSSVYSKCSSTTQESASTSFEYSQLS